MSLLITSCHAELYRYEIETAHHLSADCDCNRATTVQVPGTAGLGRRHRAAATRFVFERPRYRDAISHQACNDNIVAERNSAARERQGIGA